MQRLLSMEHPQINHPLHSLREIPTALPDGGWSWRAAPGLRFAALLLATLPLTFSAATEQPQHHAEALQHSENLYDSTVTDNTTRAELRAKFATLRPKVPPNTDPQKAGLWKVKAFAFRELDFTWKDSQGTHHHAQYRYRQDELDRLRRGMAGFADRVWKFTDGNLRIDWNLQIIERPLTKLDGDSSFWPGPDACMPYLSDLKPGQADTIMGFYEHLMRDHVTRKMWRELSLTRPADNLFLMKVANGDGGWAAILRLTDPKGAPLARVTYLTP